MHFPLFNPTWVAVAVTVLTQFFIFLRWIARKWAKDEIERVFVQDMATNHLPHIYHALKMIGEDRGLVIGDPPPVRWIQFSNDPQS